MNPPWLLMMFVVSVLIGARETANAQDAPNRPLANSPDASRAFGLSAGAARHLGSGFQCPTQYADATLTRLAVGSPTGVAAAEDSYCEYSQADVVVGYLTFSRQSAPGSPPLEAKFCHDLIASLRISMTLTMPWERQYATPAIDNSALAYSVGFPAGALWTCGWRRRMNDPAGFIIVDVSAVQTGQWILRAIYRPPEKPRAAHVAIINPSDLIWATGLLRSARAPSTPSH